MTKNDRAKLRIVPLMVSVIIGLVIWNSKIPEGVQPEAWHLFAVFVATIAAIIGKVLPMGATAMVGLAVAALTGSVSVKVAMSGFGNHVLWLIILSFFIAQGLSKTGLGRRIAYIFISLLGKSTLGLSYGLLATDLILAPAIPSNTARGGGLIYPILRSLALTFDSSPEAGTERKIGAFLVTALFHGNLITSAMFLTAMAANPIAATFASDFGLEISWGSWALAACVPGIISLIVVPYIIFKLYPPQISKTPDAARLAKRKLAEMGQMKKEEWVMLIVFFVLLTLWIFGKQLGVATTTTALVGLAILLLSNVLTWQDVLDIQSAWNTLVWFAVLLMMATQLNKMGLVAWFSSVIQGNVTGIEWMWAFLILALVYFYVHYFFASNTAHVLAMYPAFLGVGIAVGVPPMLLALVLGFWGNLYASTTHYGSGLGGVLFGSGYVDLKSWWMIGFLVSLINIAIWLCVGSLWWKIIGVY